MRLVLAHVASLESIDDSSPVKIRGVTCLVCKNESGTAASLHALERLNPASDERGRLDPVTEYPKRAYTKYKQHHEANPAAVIEAKFELNGDEIPRTEVAFGKGLPESRNLVVQKNRNIRGCEFKVNEQAGVAFVLEKSELGDELVKRLTNARTIPELIEQLDGLPDKPPSAVTLRNAFAAQFKPKNLWTRRYEHSTSARISSGISSTYRRAGCTHSGRGKK